MGHRSLPPNLIFPLACIIMPPHYQKTLLIVIFVFLVCYFCVCFLFFIYIFEQVTYAHCLKIKMYKKVFSPKPCFHCFPAAWLPPPLPHFIFFFPLELLNENTRNYELMCGFLHHNKISQATAQIHFVLLLHSQYNSTLEELTSVLRDKSLG